MNNTTESNKTPLKQYNGTCNFILKRGMKKEIRNHWNESKKQHSLSGIDFPLWYYVGQFFHLSLLFHILPRDSESPDMEQTSSGEKYCTGDAGESVSFLSEPQSFLFS